MKNQIKNIIKQFDIEYSDFDFNKDEDSIINQIEEYLIISSKTLPVVRFIMASLWQLQRRRDESVYFKTDNFKEKLNEILKNSSYQIYNGSLICKKFIACTAIKTNEGFHILNDNQINMMNSLQYGIKQYQLVLAPVIRKVYCVGKHPNVSRFDSSLCLPDYLKDVQLTIENLKMIEDTLSQFNLVSSFLYDYELQPIMGVVNEK